ncbi:hypothetical protein JW921_00575 [Candidatus Fermentibacterales bacterium]|nr:hypothetical protein [Candidatus Fermentibacterales bacterium]
MTGRAIAALSALVLLLAAAGCGGEQEGEAPIESTEQMVVPAGTLCFTANGEDFIRQGFTSKDDWQISFDHAWVNVSGVSAMQTDPPYDPHEGALPEPVETVFLSGPIEIDLAEGDETAEPIRIGVMADVPAGHYNALAWGVAPRVEGEMAPSAILLSGSAVKNADTISFRIGLDLDCSFYGGEYVGDQRKGILAEGGEADVEMTFHFDHLFGDAGSSPDDELNVGAIGFQPFVDLAADGLLDVTMADLAGSMDPEAYGKLLEILPTLGHVGEGHCLCVHRSD